MPTAVVVGSSVGGVRTAQALRSEGFTGRIVLVGEEPTVPYDKPPLSKQLLTGEWSAERATLLTSEAADRSGIEPRLGVPAVRVDLASRKVLLADGATLAYDIVILATGSSARSSPWQPTSGVHVLRTLSDEKKLRAALDVEGPVVVAGGGFIGAEVAGAARALGREVTVVDPLPAPMGHIVGPELGRYFTALHHRHGVATRFGSGVEAIEGAAGHLHVTLTEGAKLAASTAVVGIGAAPNDGWLADSELAIDDGILCDQYSRAVEVPDVYAVGDVARWFHLDHHEYVRVEHWTNAVEQASCVAHNIVHPEDLRSYRPVEYIWSDQYDWKVQIVGRPWVATDAEIVGNLVGERPRVTALFRGEGRRLIGAVTVNWPKALVQCRRWVAHRVAFDAALSSVQALGASSPPATACRGKLQ